MAVDYLARKSAKKNSHRDADTLKPRRERKKKQPRRLCRGTCFRIPTLTAEDLEDGHKEPHMQARAGQVARFALSSFSQPHITKAAAASSPASTKPENQLVSSKRTNLPDSIAALVKGGKDAARKVAQEHRLSTSIQLLDARTAKMDAPRQKQLLRSEVSQELKQFPELLQSFMAGEGYAAPMPIQSRCWPLLLQGRDMEAVAEPGSGKTLAYMLPAAVRLASRGHGADTKPDGPLSLILLPTRELAQQVASACRDMRKYSGLRTCLITGGIDKQQQVQALSLKPHIVVATPGRTLDLVQDGTLQLGLVSYLVLDEADQMLGLGMAPQLEQLRTLLLPRASGGGEGVGKKQQKLHRMQVGLFTATMPESVAEVAAAWLHHPASIRVAASAACISRTVTQVVQVCAEHKKPLKLQKHLDKIQEASKGLRNPSRVLIFTNRIKTCRFVHKLVQDLGHRVTLLHGERSQVEREDAIAAVRSGKAQMLVATDIAARGLHIRGIAYVISYDFPGNISTYIHRVGRTGRLATDGHAFSFFTREMARLAPAVVDLLQQHKQFVDPNLTRLAESYLLVKEKVGLLADATGEEQREPEKEEVLHHLGLKTQQQKKRQQRKASQMDGASCRAQVESEGSSSGDDNEAAHVPGMHEDQQPPAADTQPGEPFFVPSRHFCRVRPGYAFKKGPQGLGYYWDHWQQQDHRPDPAGQRKEGKPYGAASTVEQQQKEEYRHLKEKYTHKPIGGNGDGNKRATSNKVRREHPTIKKTGTVEYGKPMGAMLPGRLKELKRQREKAAAAGQLTGFSDSDDEGTLGGVLSSKRHKALPGRLRKKLAKQLASQD